MTLTLVFIYSYIPSLNEEKDNSEDDEEIMDDIMTWQGTTMNEQPSLRLPTGRPIGAVYKVT